jgi:hypothetical protein
VLTLALHKERHKKHDKMTQVSDYQVVNPRTTEGRINSIKAQILAITELYGHNHSKVIALRIKLSNIKSK